MNLNKNSLNKWAWRKYDLSKSIHKFIFAQKLVLPLKVDTINARMLSYTDTRGSKFGIQNLIIQQMMITEKVCVFRSQNRWEGNNIYQKTNPVSQKKWKVMGDRGVSFV